MKACIVVGKLSALTSTTTFSLSPLEAFGCLSTCTSPELQLQFKHTHAEVLSLFLHFDC